MHVKHFRVIMYIIKMVSISLLPIDQPDAFEIFINEFVVYNESVKQGSKDVLESINSLSFIHFVSFQKFLLLRLASCGIFTDKRVSHLPL